MNENELYAAIMACGPEPRKKSKKERLSVACVMALAVLAAIILRLAAAELIAGWVAMLVVSVILCVDGLLAIKLTQDSEKK